CLDSASAQGSIGKSSGLRSAARFARYLGGGSVNPSVPRFGTHQVPERSGRLSRVLGAGAARLGLPSFSLGTPLAAYPSHCPVSGRTARYRTVPIFSDLQ